MQRKLYLFYHQSLDGSKLGGPEGNRRQRVLKGPTPAYLILLRELQVVVGFQALQVVGQLHDGDGGVAGHAC